MPCVSTHTRPHSSTIVHTKIPTKCSAQCDDTSFPLFIGTFPTSSRTLRCAGAPYVYIRYSIPVFDSRIPQNIGPHIGAHDTLSLRLYRRDISYISVSIPSPTKLTILSSTQSHFHHTTDKGYTWELFRSKYVKSEFAGFKCTPIQN